MLDVIDREGGRVAAGKSIKGSFYFYFLFSVFFFFLHECNFGGQTRGHLGYKGGSVNNELERRLLALD